MQARDRRWVVSNPSAATDAEAAARGLRRRRDLYQMRVPIPLAARGQRVATRAFRPGTDDEQEWLRVNNRAFADHPDQGEFDLERLHQHMAEPWFDPEGFLLHEREGRLAGFCWTKIHPPHDPDPAMGEIFVIAVDPDLQGTGLGRALTIAGLDWLAAAGLTTGMLYVDAVNAPAITLYTSLGFERHHTDRVYSP